MKYIFQERSFFHLYLITWAITSAIQFLVHNFYFKLGWIASVTDTLVSNVILFFLLLALVHVVRYSFISKGKIKFSVFNLSIASIILLITWFFFSIEVLRRMLADNPDYLYFIKDTLIFRASTGILIAMVLNLGIINIHLIRETREAASRELKLRNLVQQTELQALKNQLNPHFIYNSLNAISSLTITAPDKAREMIIKLSDFLRFALKQDATQLIPLRSELQAIQLYLQIEKIRFGDKLQIRIDTEEHHHDNLIPVMILQPLFENAIKHGGCLAGNVGEILFETLLKENDLIMTISNPYDNRLRRFRSEGVGLENIRNRLRVIYGNGQLLQLRTTEERFFAMLTLPAVKKI